MSTPKNLILNYSAQDIEVLEGLEPVRRRPAMYIGGSDENAMHHLVAELLDNAMDEAVEGQANRIELKVEANGAVTVQDNGRGIPIEPHPKFKDKTALEVVMTMLHSGGKFTNKIYNTSGGLHGVGLSVVNALSDYLLVEIARDKTLYVQEFAKGKAIGKLKNKGPVRRRGTKIKFHPDPEIFGTKSCFHPDQLYRMARSKAFLFKGVEIRWQCDPSLISKLKNTPQEEKLHFPGGLRDFLSNSLNGKSKIIDSSFTGETNLNGNNGRVEWALAWPEKDESSLVSYCNTVITPEGGTHETGLRSALSKGLKTYAELVGNKQGAIITADDILGSTWGIISVFIPDPEFQGQTKNKLTNPRVARSIENSVKDHFDHFLSGNPSAANKLLEHFSAVAEDRLRRKQTRETARKTATRKLRLPGKLADCSNGSSEGTEIFLVEGDSAGGSAKSARNRETQAILPLRGKILNVASATADKLYSNQELNDIIQALGCGRGINYDQDKLRYERVIIMTDADVDGAHIASLLMTFFYLEMSKLIENGNLYIALPPLYKISSGSEVMYAMDDNQRDVLLKEHFKDSRKVEINRFKGLGEMPANQLKDTTMDPQKRQLLKVILPNVLPGANSTKVMETKTFVQNLMGRKPEQRLAFIQENASEVRAMDV